MLCLLGPWPHSDGKLLVVFNTVYLQHLREHSVRFLSQSLSTAAHSYGCSIAVLFKVCLASKSFIASV